MNEHEKWWRIYRATLDTNIFLRSLIRQGNLANRLLSLWRDGRFVLVLSQAIVDEIHEVLSRPCLIRKYKYSLQAVTHLIILLTQQASVVEVNTFFGLCHRDPTDNIFVDCSISGRVQFLVSTDNDLIDNSELKQALFEFGVTIIEPPDFLEKIRETEINQPDFN